MPFLSIKLKRSLSHYIIQSILGAVSMGVIFCFVNLFIETALVASLGSSIFIVFAMPGNFTARPRNLIGGHVVGIISGIAFSVIAGLHYFDHTAFLFIFTAAAVGVSILIMCITNTEHPPASGTALGLVAQPWNLGTVAFVLISVTLLALVRYGLRNYLKDLI